MLKTRNAPASAGIKGGVSVPPQASMRGDAGPSALEGGPFAANSVAAKPVDGLGRMGASLGPGFEVRNTLRYATGLESGVAPPQCGSEWFLKGEGDVQSESSTHGYWRCGWEMRGETQW